MLEVNCKTVDGLYIGSVSIHRPKNLQERVTIGFGDVYLLGEFDYSSQI